MTAIRPSVALPLASNTSPMKPGKEKLLSIACLLLALFVVLAGRVIRDVHRDGQPLISMHTLKASLPYVLIGLGVIAFNVAAIVFVRLRRRSDRKTDRKDQSGSGSA